MPRASRVSIEIAAFNQLALEGGASPAEIVEKGHRHARQSNGSTNGSAKTTKMKEDTPKASRPSSTRTAVANVPRVETERTDDHGRRLPLPSSRDSASLKGTSKRSCLLIRIPTIRLVGSDCSARSIDFFPSSSPAAGWQRTQLPKANGRSMTPSVIG